MIDAIAELRQQANLSCWHRRKSLGLRRWHLREVILREADIAHVIMWVAQPTPLSWEPATELQLVIMND